MKKLLTIELSQEWVLSHRTDDILPIALIERELSGVGGLEIKDKTFKQLELLFEDSIITEPSLNEKLVSIIKEHYPNETPQVSIRCRAEQGDELVDEFNEMLSALGQCSEKPTVTKNDDGMQQVEVLAQIDDLIGAAEFKQIAHEIAQIAPEVRSRKTYEIFLSQCYLFSIGDGCGTTTCVELLAKLFAECFKDAIAVRGIVEHKLPPDRDAAGYDPFEEVKSILQRGRKNELSVLCVDISEWMNFTERAKFREFLRLVEKASNQFIVIFRIPFVEKDVLERIQTSLCDLLYVRAVTFPPLTSDELKSGTQTVLSGYGFSVQDSAWAYFHQRIASEKSDGKFYEMSTVKKIVSELLYKKQLANAQGGKSSSEITDDDMQRICSFEEVDALTSGETQLKALIGNEKIRARLDEVLAQIDLALKDGRERPCIHMRFVGNPGTGKTTIARILGKILKERGILRIGNFYEYAGRDFCGRYVGETAPKTASMCRDAYGSVLFIDEAYTLYKEGSSVDYGREAIDTLIAEMENHRNDFVVIMAGYTDEMNALMRGNLGLASRMPYTIEFPNFSRDELYSIFKSMVTVKFKYDDKLLSAAKEYFANLSDEVIASKSFSNARYVRNLFERTWAKASLRCQLEGSSEVTLTRDDFERASGDIEFSTPVKKRNRIGF